MQATEARQELAMYIPFFKYYSLVRFTFKIYFLFSKKKPPDVFFFKKKKKTLERNREKYRISRKQFPEDFF